MPHWFEQLILINLFKRNITSTVGHGILVSFYSSAIEVKTLSGTYTDINLPFLTFIFNY